MTMRKLSLPFLLPWLAFLIPVNIYIIGDWSGAGIQWVLFRYQQTIMGTSYISVGNDINYIMMGLLQTKTLVSVLLWLAGSIILIISLMGVLKGLFTPAETAYKRTGLLVLISAILFLVSDLIQYGPVLSSKYSTCLPVGIPLLFIIGYWEFRYSATRLPAMDEGSLRSFLGEHFPGRRIWTIYCESPVLQELAMLLLVSVFVKIMVFSVSVFAPQQIIQTDIKLYYSYFRHLLSGNVPYAMLSVEYPQFFFIPVLLAAVPTLVVQEYSVFSLSFIVLMYLFDLFTLVCVYLLARKLFGDTRAFLCGLLYATAFTTAYYVPLTYDIFPAFLFMLALLLFVYGRETAAYLSATAGVLAKWFPVFCYPLFFLSDLKSNRPLRPSFRGLGISAIVILISTVPFYLLNPRIFLFTYTWHLNRPEDSHGLIYYLDAISGLLFHTKPFFGLSLLILVLGECAIIAWYYRYLDAREITLCATLFLCTFYFVLVNKAASPNFLIWITPFLALFFAGSKGEIFWFYSLQLIMYIEAPILTGIIWLGDTGYPVIQNAFPTSAFLFYTVKFSLLGIGFFWIIRRVHQDFSDKNINPGVGQSAVS